MGLSEGFFRKKVLGQLKGGMKLLILTVLIYPGQICKGYTHKKSNLLRTCGWVVVVTTNTKVVGKSKPRDINMTTKMGKSCCLFCASATFLWCFSTFLRVPRRHMCLPLPCSAVSTAAPVVWSVHCSDLFYPPSAKGSAVRCDLNKPRQAN